MRLIVLLLFLMIFTGFLEAQEKKTAALAPLVSMGDLDEIQKNIIFNSLQESLSKFYTLTSIKMYEKAEEEAFQQIDANECTEAQCIAIIQELLQVEFFFMFQILKSDDFQQLKLTRVDLDANRDVRTDTCEKCDISKINSKVNSLVLSVNDQGYPQINQIISDTNDESKKDFSREPAGTLALWDIVKNKDEIEDYKMFIEKYPDSSLVVPAEYRINEKIERQNEVKEIQRKNLEKKEKKQVDLIRSRWKKAECKKSNPIKKNHYLVYAMTFPFDSYGINRNSGEIVRDHNEAVNLKKNDDLVGSFLLRDLEDESNYKIFKIIMSVSSYSYTIGGVASSIFNTSCYDTYEDGHPLLIKYASFNSKELEEEIAGSNNKIIKPLLSLRGCDDSAHKKIIIELKEKYGSIYNQSTLDEIKAFKILENLDQIISSDPWLKASCNGYSPVDVVALN